MPKYTETQAPSDDPEIEALDQLADGHPYVFIVAKISTSENGDGIDLRVASAYGVDVIRPILEKTLRALP